MRSTVFILVVSGALIGLLIAANRAAPPSGTALRLRDLNRYVRITEQPYEMHDSTILYCKQTDEVALNPHEPARPEKAFCHVYVNDKAKEPMLSGKGNYPEGAIVIKSKLATVDSQQPLLFTVMEKMAEGYDSDRGNWKYTVIDGTSYRQVASGRIDSCIDCHSLYKQTDYITREYLKP
ncbi:MAG: cytochrome P460 family protein [Pirellulaceae bacterium]|nr:cytochrome P460 family protein [Pirellulaceae bacterium]